MAALASHHSSFSFYSIYLYRLRWGTTIIAVMYLAESFTIPERVMVVMRGVGGAIATKIEMVYAP